MNRTVSVRGYRQAGDCDLAAGHPAYDTEITVRQAQEVTDQIVARFKLPEVRIEYNGRKTKNLRAKLLPASQADTPRVIHMYPTGDNLGELVHALCHLVDDRHKVPFQRLQERILRWIDDQDMLDYLWQVSGAQEGSGGPPALTQAEIDDILPDLAQGLCDRSLRDEMGGTPRVTRLALQAVLDEYRITGYHNLAMLEALVRDGGARIE